MADDPKRPKAPPAPTAKQKREQHQKDVAAKAPPSGGGIYQSNNNSTASTPVQNYNQLYADAVNSGLITAEEAQGINKARNGEGFKTIEQQKAVVQEYKIAQAKNAQRIEQQAVIARQQKQKAETSLKQQRAELVALQREQAYWNSPAGQAKAHQQVNGLSHAQRRRPGGTGIPSQTISKRIENVKGSIANLSSTILIYDKAITKSQQNTKEGKTARIRREIYQRASQRPSDKGRTNSDVRIGNFYYPKSEVSNTVTTPDGKTRTFKDYNHGEKFIGRTENNYQTQGPSNQLSYTVNLAEGKKPTGTGDEGIVGFPGSLDYIAKKEERKSYPEQFTRRGSGLLEDIYSYVDKNRIELQRLEKENPDNFIIAELNSLQAVTGNVLNTISYGGELLDKYVLKNEGKYKRKEISIVPTYVDTGISSTLKGTVTAKYPYIHADKFSIQRGINKAQQQMGNQTLVQNVAQTTTGVGGLVIDVLTGRELVKLGVKTGKGLFKTVRKSRLVEIPQTPDTPFTRERNIIELSTNRGTTFGSSPTQMTGVRVTQEGRTFTDTIPNPYGKERTIPYKIKQGVEYVKNIKSPIKTPYVIGQASKNIKADIQYAKYIVNKNIPSLPTIPQKIKDVGIKIQLVGQDLNTQAGILKRNTQLGISRGIQYGQDVLGRNTPSVPNIIREAKYRTQLGISDVKTKIGIIQREDRILTGKVKIAGQVFKMNQQLAFNLKKQDAITKLGIVKGGIEKPFVILGKEAKVIGGKIKKPIDRQIGIINQKANVIGGKIKIEINKPILEAKYRTQLGVQDLKTKGRIIKLDLAKRDPLNPIRQSSEVLRDKSLRLKTRIGLELSETKKGIINVLGENYQSKPKWVTPAYSKNALRNIVRESGPFGEGKPKDFINPIKRDKTPFGYSTRKVFGEVSKATARQKEKISDVLFDIGQQGRKGMNTVGKFPGINITKNPRKNFNIQTQGRKQNFIGPKQPVDLPRRTLGNPLKDPLIKSQYNKRVDYPRKPIDLPERSFVGGIPLKFKPNAVEKLKQIESKRKLERFKLGYKKEPTELQGRISEVKSITGQAKQKISAKEFDNPITRLSKDKKKFDVIGDKIQYGMQEMFKQPKRSISPTKISRAIAKHETPVNDIQKLMKQRKLERKQLGQEKWSIGDRQFNKDLKKIGGTSKPNKLFGKGLTKIKNWKPKETDKDLTKKYGEPNKQGQITRIVNKADKRKRRRSPLNPEPVPIDYYIPAPYATPPPNNSNNQLLPPIVKIERQDKIPTPTIRGPKATRQPTVTRIISNAGIREIIKPKTIIREKINTKVAPRQNTITRTSSVQVFRQNTKQTPKQKPRQRTRHRSRSPEIPKTPTTQKPLQKPIPKQQVKLIEVPPRVPKPAVLVPPFALDSKTRPSRKSRTVKRDDFLGNTKTDEIEGLFKRNTIITGTKKVNKQITKDKKVKVRDKVRIF